MDFKLIELEDKPILDPYLKKWMGGNAEHSFAHLFIWSTAWTTKYAIVDDVLYIRQRHRSLSTPSILMAPIPMDENAKYCQAMKVAERFFEEEGDPFKLKGVSKLMVDHIKKHCQEDYVIEYDRDASEYVYSIEDLIELKGRKYRNKRNHISRFEDFYTDHEFVIIDHSNKLEALELYEKWFFSRSAGDQASMLDERFAVTNALSNLDDLECIGAMVRVNGVVEAFTVGEKLSDEMVLIHLEKANADIQGLYPFINREFLKHCFSDMKYVNREEDMGLEGLRRAKESYHPVFLVDKHTITLPEEKQA